MLIEATRLIINKQMFVILAPFLCFLSYLQNIFQVDLFS